MRLQQEKYAKMFLVAIAAVLFLVLLSGCNKETSLSGVSFLEDTVTIEKSETYALNLLGVDDKEITWKSEDKSVATVKDGVVYAKKKGSTKILACIGKESIACDVVIADNKYVPTIEWNEPDDGLNLEKNETYVLAPVLSYNGNTYTDVEYTYQAIGDGIKVDDSGVVTASNLGEGVVNVTGMWRDNEVKASLPVHVVDVSTSIEVGNDKFEIYLNGEGLEYPGKADLGIVVFDQNTWIQNPGASVKYRENVTEGDVQGAATVKDGIVYATKLGTTNFVAEYTSKSGKVVRSAEFSVSVERTPADIYMTPIEGEEFEFFFEPLGTDNSVKWDEKQQVFHLINKSATNSDARGFIVNKEYLANIIRYTKAESISFEYKTDNNPTGLVSDDQTIYQGFYPQWYGTDDMHMTRISDKWTETEIFFDDIPNDQSGVMKTIFLMNTVEGLYVRNIKLYLPGEDRTEYDPNHNYLEDIEGQKYEFFIEALSDKNSVKWNKKTKSYHLTNKVAEGTDERGFIFNKDYLTNIIRHTKAESISFEYKTDGKRTSLKTDDETIYQGFYPDWWDEDHMQRLSLPSKWTKIEIFLDDIPKDEKGNYKTIFLMNTIEGMHIRNIKLHLPGEDRTNYDSNHNYMEDIEGEDYEFFIEPLSGKNSVKWDKTLSAYHLTNKVTEETNERGFVFNRDYFTNIVKHTKAESISFEYKTDGKGTGLKTNDLTIYQGFYPDWWDEDHMQRLSLSSKWTKIEIFFDDIPKDEKGNLKTVFLMNTIEGMYIRNIKLHLPGEDRTGYDPNHNYLEDIKGTEYEFFIESLSDKNSVKWDAATSSYHLTNKVQAQDSTRGFIFNRSYFANIIEHTKAETITFEYKTDGNKSGIVTDDKAIYQGFYPDWWDASNMQRFELSNKWTEIEIRLDSIPKDANGNVKTVFMMNTVEGIYIRNIKIHLPGESPSAGDDKPEYDYLTPIEGKEFEFFIIPQNADNSVAWDAEKKVYHLVNKVTTADNSRAFLLDTEYITSIIKHTNAEAITFEFTQDSVSTGAGGDDKAIYTSYYPEWYGRPEMQRHGLTDKWKTMEIKLDEIPKDTNGNILAPFIMNTDGGMYIRNITIKLPVTYEVAETLRLEEANLSWLHGDETGLTGGNISGTISYDDGSFKMADCLAYATHKFAFRNATKEYSDDMKIRFRIKATPNGTDINNLELRFYNYEANGSIGDGTVEYVLAKIPSQGEWTSVELDLAAFLNDKKQFTGLGFATFGYRDWSSGQMYTIELDEIEILEPVEVRE